MNDSYLILHKVRGEPQFDVAEQMSVDGNIWWIIPTSGHRAHPMFTWKLTSLVEREVERCYVHCASIPSWLDLPDHYHAARKPELAARPTHFTADDL